MARIRWPRRGSMQYWPRKRAKRHFARVRNWSSSASAKPLGFAGYKVGMTHVLYTDAGKYSITKGEDIFCPVTVIECPPLKIIGYQAYKKDAYGEKACFGGPKFDEAKLQGISDIRLVVQTQPSLTGIGNKKPEVFEVAIGGDLKARMDYVKNSIGKEIRLNDVFAEGQLVDTHAVTKGKGTQGPVKRFGVSIRQHKAEKTKRGPATLGPWHPHHGNYRVAHAGKMGYHQRTQLNKWIMKISNDNKSVNQKGGWLNYGVVKSDYLIMKGSVDGPAKRIIRMTNPRRLMKNQQEAPPEIQYLSARSKQ